MRTWLALATLGLITASDASLAGAQDPPSPELPPPFSLTYVDGRADVARADGVVPAQAPDVLDAGDRLLVAAGRAELVSASGSLVHVDRDADLRVDDDGRLRLVRGRIVVHTAASETPLDLVTPVGVVGLEPRGEYVITARDLDADVTITALTGRASLALPTTDVPIAANDLLAVDPRGLELRWSRAADGRDAFTDWAERRVADMQQSRETQPLPVELTAYAPDFATYGDWDTLPVYGSVWFPATAPGWRPYANGSWRHTRHGWTWIDRDRWGWPVHHYGRWGRHASRGWYWMPRRAWGPAWVGWALEADYVGWAPLGWDSRPVVDFFVGARVGPLDLWASSWSVVPRHVFGHRGPVGPYYTDLRRLPGPVLGGFISQARPPRGPGGWDRRGPPVRGYGRPAPAGRGARVDAGAPGGQSRPGADGFQRPDARPRFSADAATPPRADTPSPSRRDAAADPRQRRGPAAPADAPTSTWREPVASGASRAVVAPRPGDAGPDRDASRSPARAVAPRRGDEARYGRPAPGAGRGAGSAETAPARPRPGPTGGERTGSGGGGSAGTTTSGTRGTRGASGGGNRRPR